MNLTVNYFTFRRALTCAVLAFFTSVLAPSAFSQGSVSSGLSGTIKDSTGKFISGASVVAKHEPTGTTYSATTGLSGRYSMGGMIVGGPYTVTATAPSYSPAAQENVTTLLGGVIDANLTLKTGTADVVTMEKFTVQSDPNDLDSSMRGAGSVVTSDAINSAPTVQRSFADIARTNAFVDVRSVLASRSQPIISAAGQNNRFNSIQVDGARINDQFGLNGSGLQSFGNPISLDTIEQFNISVSPYDVSQSGFTGASINAVTKSGTNQFHGTLYYFYTDEDFQGSNVFGSTAGTRAPLEQKTKGLTLGGPLWKDHLFFFINYERFDSTTSDIGGLNVLGTAQGTADFASISARLATIKSTLTNGSVYDFGSYKGTTSSITQYDQKKLAKLDWNIVQGQRVSLRYSKIEGALPDTAKFKYGGSSGSTVNTLLGAAATGVANATFGTNLSSNQFSQKRNEEVWASQLFSQWTPDFKTELKWSKNRYSQATPVPIAFPEIRIFGVSGLASTGATLAGTGALVLGTEQNRQGNFVSVDTKSYSATGEYLWDKFTFSGGFDREESKFVNLFRSSSYGIFDYASVAAFTADTPIDFGRSYYQVGTPIDERSDFAINGVFGQAKWDVTPKLNLVAGLRYDWFTAGNRPPFNPTFFNVFGMRNDGTVNGSDSVSPRLSFNYTLDDAHTTQFRGGIGHFVGRIPWVFISNSYGNSGVGRSQKQFVNSTATPTPSLLSYLQTSFDPRNPIGSATDLAVTRPAMNLVSNKLEAPSVYRGNLAMDRKLDFLSSVFTLEFVGTQVDRGLFIRDINLKPTYLGSDGRQVYAGTSSTTANALHPEFSNVLAMSNVNVGQSAYVSAGLQRQMKDHWSYNLTFTRGSSRDAMLLGETTAISQFQRNPVFNQNTPEVGRSAFEIKDRLQFALTREFEFIKKWKSTVSLYYEGRTGNPYSFVYSNDLNLDGASANDLLYVPRGVDDPALANLSPATAQSYMDFINSVAELRDRKGSAIDRNSSTTPWINRLDLHVAQRIPLYFKTAEFEIFADFVNFGSWLSKRAFGYVETINGAGDNELFSTRSVGAASYDANHILRVTSFTGAGTNAVPNNELSRWRIQFGGRLKF